MPSSDQVIDKLLLKCVMLCDGKITMKNTFLKSKTMNDEKTKTLKTAFQVKG